MRTEIVHNINNKMRTETTSTTKMTTERPDNINIKMRTERTSTTKMRTERPYNIKRLNDVKHLVSRVEGGWLVSELTIFIS